MIIAGSADTYVSEQRTRASSVLDPASILSRRFEIGLEYYKPLSLPSGALRLAAGNST